MMEKSEVKYVSADTSGLDNPKRLVPVTEFMTPRRSTKQHAAKKRFTLLIMIFSMMAVVAMLCMSFVWFYGLPGLGEERQRFESEEQTDEMYRHSMRNEDGKVCNLDKDPGMCMAAMPRWYYDQEKGQCIQFTYGGCDGNGNNFHTHSDCSDACENQEAVFPLNAGRESELKKMHEEDSCRILPAAGSCKEQIPRFYFDFQSRTCLRFLYSGCAGNTNNFMTEEECRSECVIGDQIVDFESRDVICGLPSDGGTCRALFPKWYHDADAGECKEFTWGGCGGNDNQFTSMAKCEEFCLPPAVADERGEEEDVCQLPQKVGKCRAAHPRYYFNGDKCEFFIYGGCDANGNNFMSMEECQEICETK